MLPKFSLPHIQH
ncbi:hypothetical protein MACK_003572 [Theileria orientalis]|uniref:Uncharacterized protein n=1 Tax=Theileria orientalis TaxID=68886 RepID=A0A976XIT4_THEOR|nr:hypothetical protein MACK_003572 [Theileria orientalis]